MNLEVSDSSQKKLSELLAALRDGVLDEDGSVLRHPIPPGELASRLKVRVSTIWNWRDNNRWPRGEKCLEDLSDVVGAGHAAFQAYFQGQITLKELFSLGVTVRPKESLEEVWNRYLQLDLPDQLQLEGRILMRRAESLEVPNQMELAIANRYGEAPIANRSRVNAYQENDDLIGSKPATLCNALQKKSSRKMAQLGSGWSDKELLRVQALVRESLKKNKANGKPGTPGKAAEEAGVDPATFDRASLRMIEGGTLEQLRGIRFFPGLVNALSVICYETDGWNGISPRRLLDNKYSSPEALMRDLALNHDHEHQQA